ncbi:hypothetical protein BJV82DRAFT_22459 [Fennellomyces sp. T-0311]|nr:hypothetical protein BJV82DRAFT_22459 [Fennellomyces sp. T-0311]
MGSTVSKATPSKQGLDNTQNYGRHRGSTVGCENTTKPDSAKKRALLPVLLQRDDDDQKAKKKKKKGKKHNVKSISVKRNAKYKKITKSIIGRPANFQHMGHIGGDQPRMTVHHSSCAILLHE